MSLSTYNKKRKFSKTPEPKGAIINSTGPLTFVVQKHQASRLHYDFRLELDGVLKSWAVPKGPSLNPEDRHLAVMVEDHPLDYASFEGIIPKGNYGAGTVMVWDKGVYTPYGATERHEAEKILHEQLNKGHLTFVLLGEKLKGEFALVKTRGEEDNAWLLLKKGDEYASKVDVLKKDYSVNTDRSMSEIAKQAQKKKQVWVSKPNDIDLDEAPKAQVPHHIKPMLAESIDEPFDNPDWIFEMKWDGYRMIAEISSGKIELYSRNNQPFTEKFAQIAESLKKFPTSAVLDGEGVVLDASGHPKFQWLQDYPSSNHGELVYYVFDILYYDGHDTTHLPLLKRKELLKKVLPPLPHVLYSEYIENTGKAFFEAAKKLGVEGIMAKNTKSIYRQGVRNREWLKIKTSHRQEAVIAGFTRPKGGRKYFGALVLGVYKGDRLEYIGHTGGGFDDKALQSMHKKLIKLRQDKNPFEYAIETNAPVTWVKPQLVCEVSFAQWTADHHMRQPIFVGLRPDKKPVDVKRERTFPFIPTPDHSLHTELKSSSIKTEENEKVQIDTHNLQFSNLSKVFWPKEKYTKRNIIEYYKSISKAILPHLKDRPQSLLRYPNGITGESFFQKNVGELVPDWIKTVRVKTENHDITYMLCQDEATLLYMINLGCIDLNPWSSRINHLDSPDYLVIDLDPEKTSFANVVRVALKVREVLEELEIEGYPKTSGAKGIHIYIPTAATYTYEQIKHFAELLCLRVHTKIPNLTSLVRSPEKRQGKIYLDYLQNRNGQTLASVYSVRAQPGATVSTPLLWKELTPKLTPEQFTIKNIIKRLDKHGDLFKPTLGAGISIEKALTILAKQ